MIWLAVLWGLALPSTATTLKIVFDNTPGYEAYGFLIGEPVDKHFQSKAQVRLKIYQRLRKAKRK